MDTVRSSLGDCVINTTEAVENNSLHLAAARGHCDIIRMMVEAGSCLETIDNNYETPLLSALRHGQQAAVELLLDLGANCNVLNRGWKTPLQLAIGRMNIRLVEVLLYNHAIIHHSDLDDALFKRRLRIVDTMLTTDNSTVDRANSEGHCFLIQSVIKGDVQSVKLLIKHKCNVNAVDDNRWTALHHAVYLDNMTMVKILLNANANPRLSTMRKYTPIYLSIINSNLKMIELLIGYGADFKVKSSKIRVQILNRAVQCNSPEIAEILIKKYSNEIDSRDDDGNTPLLLAAKAGNHHAVDLLMLKCENVNVRDKLERDALYLAVWKCHTETIQKIIRNTPNRPFYRRQNVSRQIGLYPNVIFSCIKSNLSNDIIELLIKSASLLELHEKNMYDQTILHMAVINQNIYVINLIKKYCSDIDIHALDSFNQTPFSISSDLSNFEIILLLLGNEMNENIDEILLRAIKHRNVNCIRALLNLGIAINDNHINASIDIESSDMYIFNSNTYYLEHEDRLENSILGLLASFNYVNYKKASDYAVKKLKYKVIHRLHYNGYFESKNYTCDPNTYLYYLFDALDKYKKDVVNKNIQLDIFYAIECDFNIFYAIFKHYWATNKNFDELGPYDETPLHKAIRLGNVEAAAVLIQHGANPKMSRNNLSKCRRIFNESFYNLLIDAGANQHEQVLSLLQLSRIAMRKDSNIFRTVWNGNSDYGLIEFDHIYNLKNAYTGKTSLHCAAELGMNYALDALLDELMSIFPDAIHSSDDDGMTALLYSAASGHTIILKSLIKAGLDLNHVNNAGNNALHEASRFGHVTMVTLLLNHGMNPRDLNNAAQTPLILASSSVSNNTDVINALIAADPDSIHTSDIDGFIPILYSARTGIIDHFKILFKAGSDLNHVDKHGNSALHVASRYGHINMVTLLLDHGMNPRQLNSLSQTPLILASSSISNNTDVINVLIAADPDSIHTSDDDGVTSLMWSARAGIIENFKSLLKAGSNLYHINTSGNNSLHEASIYAHDQIVSLLLNYGMDPRQINNIGRTPLILASDLIAINIDVINALIDAAPDSVYTSDHCGMNALLVAAGSGNIDNFMALLNAGSDINHVNDVGNNALHEASRLGRVTMVSLLLDHGINPRQLNNEAQTALMLASSSVLNNTDVINALIAADPDSIHTSDFDGFIPILYSARTGMIDHFKILFIAGSDLNHVDKHGNNALHVASRFGHVNMVVLLLEHGVNPRHLNNEGQTPLMLASSSVSNNTDVINALIAADPDSIHTSDFDGFIPILYSARTGIIDHFTILFKAGSDLNHVDKHGNNALHVASRFGHVNMVVLLLEHGVNPRHLNNEGQTPLMLASSSVSNNTDVINILTAATSDSVDSLVP